MRHLSRKNFHWDEDGDLIFQHRAVCSLVPHKTILDHYHLKFYWRAKPTPEFFNIVNAKENARVYSFRHEQETLSRASQSDLNEGRATHAAN